MALEKLTADLDIIQKLDDEPNDVGGLTAQELKAKFDEAGNTIQKYLNEKLVPELENLGVEQSVLLPENSAGFKYLRLNADKVLEVSTDGETWQATGSSGHLILDSAGNSLPQRSRMQFTNGTVTDDGVKTIVTGVKGDKGDKGDQGDKGDTGAQGPIGKTGPTVVPSVDANGVMSFSIQDIASAPQSVSVRGPQGPQGVQGEQGAQGARGPQGIQGIQGVQGTQGEQGETGPKGATGPAGPQGPIGPQGERGNDGADGRSFVIQDIYDTLAQLKADFPYGNEYAYQVRSENNEIFIYSENEEDWTSLGQLQGPRGAQGPAGPQGPQGEKGDTGPQGPQGVQGVQGEQGATGPEGPAGPAGVSGKDGKSAYTSATEAGYTGTETAFNAALSQVPEHIENADIHVTAAEKTKWNAIDAEGAADAVAAELVATYDPNGKAQDIFAYADTKMPKTGGAFTGTTSGVSPASGSTKAFRNIYFGSGAPVSSLGANGDIYINIG